MLIPLTQEKFAIVDAADYDYLMQWKWHTTISNGKCYAARRAWRGGKLRPVYMHREIMRAPKGKQVDHRDGDGLNNTRANLRLATSQQNNMNRRTRKDSKSGYKGVWVDKKTGKWQAQIALNGKRIHLGLFDTPLEASRAYSKAAHKLFGDFAQINDG